MLIIYGLLMQERIYGNSWINLWLIRVRKKDLSPDFIQI